VHNSVMKMDPLDVQRDRLCAPHGLEEALGVERVLVFQLPAGLLVPPVAGMFLVPDRKHALA